MFQLFLLFFADRPSFPAAKTIVSEWSDSSRFQIQSCPIRVALRKLLSFGRSGGLSSQFALYLADKDTTCLVQLKIFRGRGRGEEKEDASLSLSFLPPEIVQ